VPSFFRQPKLALIKIYGGRLCERASYAKRQTDDEIIYESMLTTDRIGGVLEAGEQHWRGVRNLLGVTRRCRSNLLALYREIYSHIRV